MMRDVNNDSRLRRAERRGLSAEVADRIREAIFAGVYPPGAQLRETEIAVELDVSRGPVREALLMLQGEGLVRIAWHRSTTVTTLDPTDISELDSLRAALENLAVQLVIDTAGEDDLDAIATAAARMAQATDPHELVARDIAFHDALYAATAHTRLIEAWRAIRNQVHLFLLVRIATSTDGYLDTLPAEHRDLADVLRSRDRDRALALFDQHRRQAFDIVTGSRANEAGESSVDSPAG